MVKSEFAREIANFIMKNGYAEPKPVELDERKRYIEVKTTSDRQFITLDEKSSIANLPADTNQALLDLDAKNLDHIKIDQYGADASINEIGLAKNIRFTKNSIKDTIMYYTMETGVRELERCFDKIFRKVIIDSEINNNLEYVIDDAELQRVYDSYPVIWKNEADCNLIIVKKK